MQYLWVPFSSSNKRKNRKLFSSTLSPMRDFIELQRDLTDWKMVWLKKKEEIFWGKIAVVVVVDVVLKFQCIMYDRRWAAPLAARVDAIGIFQWSIQVCEYDISANQIHCFQCSTLFTIANLPVRMHRHQLHTHMQCAVFETLKMHWKFEYQFYDSTFWGSSKCSWKFRFECNLLCNKRSAREYYLQ